MRNAFTGAAILMVMGSGAAAGARRQTEPESQLTVRVYDLAHVGADDLHQAEERADRIFRQARIRITWVLVSVASEGQEHHNSGEWNPADLHLRLWPRAGIGSNSFSEETLGFRLSVETSTAIIIADEVCKRAALQFMNPGELLGLVMAHEIGHLLLRSKAHSSEGIMQGQLSTNLRDRRRTLLVFTRKQAVSMQNEIRRRMGVPLREPAELTVGVYNYAKLSADELGNAEQEAAEVFSRAGIQLRWIACPVSHGDADKLRDCNEALTRGALYLNILPEPMVTKSKRPPRLMGAGLEDHASVFADRAVKLADEKGISPRVVLGLAMAHELGHLVLGAEHEATGIMVEDLQVEQFRRAQQGVPPAFSAEQVQRMRAWLHGESLVKK
jgi:hypothetical protein